MDAPLLVELSRKIIVYLDNPNSTMMAGLMADLDASKIYKMPLNQEKMQSHNHNYKLNLEQTVEVLGIDSEKKNPICLRIDDRAFEPDRLRV